METTLAAPGTSWGAVFGLWSGLGYSTILLLLLLLLALALSSYVKIVTVLGILRVGLGVESLPSAFVAGALALVLSLLIMEPTLERSLGAMDAQLKKAPQSQAQAIQAAADEWKQFVQRHAHEDERRRFGELSERLSQDKTAKSTQASSDRWSVLAPAFFVSELKEAFATGLSILLPFLVIDLLVANVLLLLGYAQMSPLFLALPLKLLLFVMIDGWSLIASKLVETYV